MITIAGSYTGWARRAQPVRVGKPRQIHHIGRAEHRPSEVLLRQPPDSDCGINNICPRVQPKKPKSYPSVLISVGLDTECNLCDARNAQRARRQSVLYTRAQRLQCYDRE